MLATLAARPQSLLVCLGGSATIDGGAGMRAVVGRWLQDIPVRVACDVRNPLLGARGAARAFGPQKGATPDVVDELERRLEGMPELAGVATLPGAGAAGGLGAALASLGATLVPGGELVLDLIRFDEVAAGADLVVTGEGTVDVSSAEGKATGAVAAACRSLGVRCVVFGGRVERAAAADRDACAQRPPGSGCGGSGRAGRGARASAARRGVGARPSSSGAATRSRRSTRRAAGTPTASGPST